MNKIIDKLLQYPAILGIISWIIFIGGDILYFKNIIPQSWGYVFGFLIGVGVAFFDTLEIFASKLSKDLEEEVAEIYAEYDAKHQARLEEFEKLKKEYGIDDKE